MFHYNTIVFIVEGTGLLLKHKYTVSLQSDGCHHMRPKAEVLYKLHVWLVWPICLFSGFFTQFCTGLDENVVIHEVWLNFELGRIIYQCGIPHSDLYQNLVKNSSSSLLIWNYFKVWEDWAINNNLDVYLLHSSAQWNSENDHCGHPQSSDEGECPSMTKAASELIINKCIQSKLKWLIQNRICKLKHNIINMKRVWNNQQETHWLLYCYFNAPSNCLWLDLKYKVTPAAGKMKATAPPSKTYSVLFYVTELIDWS